MMKSLLELVDMEIRDLLSKYEFDGDNAQIIRGSATKALEDDEGELGLGAIQKLMDAIDSEIAEPVRGVDKPLFMSVEDVFTITGRGTVATGRIEEAWSKSVTRLRLLDWANLVQPPALVLKCFAKNLEKVKQVTMSEFCFVALINPISKRSCSSQLLGSIKPHTKAKAQIYVLNKEEGGRHTPFFKGYRPQFFFGTAGVTGVVELPDGVEMVMPGDNLAVEIDLQKSIAMEAGQRFAIEGGKTIGAGNISDIL